MTIAERHKFILDKLSDVGFVNVTDLSRDMNVTTVTVRKDLKILEDKKLLFRSHGSATPVSPYVKDKPVNEKRLVRVDDKQKIVLRTVGLIEENDAIIIASGTTVLALAKAIPQEMKITVITGAMNVSAALLDHQNIEIIQLGGVVRKSSASVVGHYAEDMLLNFGCTKLFLGVDGISSEYGLTTSNMMEAHLNGKMIKAAQKIIVLTDSGKFGKKGFGKICDIDDIDIIITDEGISETYRSQFEERGIEVIVAGVVTSAS